MTQFQLKPSEIKSRRKWKELTSLKLFDNKMYICCAISGDKEAEKTAMPKTEAE